jgi:hypothetical protein
MNESRLWAYGILLTFFLVGAAAGAGFSHYLWPRDEYPVEAIVTEVIEESPTVRLVEVVTRDVAALDSPTLATGHTPALVYSLADIESGKCQMAVSWMDGDEHYVAPISPIYPCSPEELTRPGGAELAPPDSP